MIIYITYLITYFIIITYFITLKDHKPNFRNSPSCRLINPAKSEIGHISKVHLENCVAAVSAATGLNQWRKTSTVIEWFRNIRGKKHSSLLNPTWQKRA